LVYLITFKLTSYYFFAILNDKKSMEVMKALFYTDNVLIE